MSNMKCPFCGEELETMFGISESVLGCHKCRHIATIGVWQALIDGKKAQDALKVATDFIGFVNTSRHADGALAAMAIGKLNEITSITKQDKMS